MAQTILLAANNVYLFYSVARDGVGHEELPSLAPDATVRIVPGDINSDDAINIHDLNGIRNNFGQRGNHILGDAADDGDVDIGDLYNVQNYLGATAPSIGAPMESQFPLALRPSYKQTAQPFNGPPSGMPRMQHQSLRRRRT